MGEFIFEIFLFNYIGLCVYISSHMVFWSL